MRKSMRKRLPNGARHVERDAAAQLGRQVDVVGVDLGQAGHQQHVVKGQGAPGRCLRASGATGVEAFHRLVSPRDRCGWASRWIVRRQDNMV